MCYPQFDKGVQKAEWMMSLYYSLLVLFCFLQAEDGSMALKWTQKDHQDEAAELIKKQMEEKGQLQ